MTQPLFFRPDPQIPDADLLGYGDLFGANMQPLGFLNGDPELAAQLQPYAAPDDPEQYGPPAPEQPPLLDGQYTPDQLEGDFPTLQGEGGRQFRVTPMGLQPMEGVQDPNTGELLDPGQPATDPLAPLVGGAQVLGSSVGVGPLAGATQEEKLSALGLGGGAEPPAPEAPAGGAPAQGPLLDGRYNAQQLEGDFPVIQAPGGQAFRVTPMGLQPYERQGALPPDVAQRQLGALQTQQGAYMDAAMQARSDEARLYREENLRQMAQLEAQKSQREADQQEMIAKVARWRDEQQQVLNMGISDSYLDAAGPVASLFAVLGATLLGGAGSDAGLRMMERRVDRFVTNQVQTRNTRLNILAEQIGSTEQAIRLGKAELYKLMGDQSELMMAKTKNDVFEAQAPAILEQMKMKALENYQAAEQLSLGKMIERVPPPPKPTSPEALQKYGELRRERDAAGSMVQRVEQQLGLVWAPGQNGQPGHYANGAQVLKEGIQGVGSLEQLAPDLLYSIAGQAAAEGYQVRGAIEALAYAQVRQMQPTGPISNVDAKVGKMAAAMQTEEGLLQGLARLRMGEQQQQQNDAAQFGPDVVAEYNRRFQAAGGRMMQSQPAASRPATVEEAKGAALRMSGGRAPSEAPGQIPPDAESRMQQLSSDVMALGSEAQLPPGAIDILIAQAAHESRNGDSQGAEHGNMFGHKSSKGGRAFEAMTTEGEGAAAVRVPQSFADYGSIAENVADHLSLLQRRYPRAWEALQAEDPAAYVAALKDGGYFTGNENVYLDRILQRL